MFIHTYIQGLIQPKKRSPTNQIVGQTNFPKSPQFFYKLDQIYLQQFNNTNMLIKLHIGDKL